MKKKDVRIIALLLTVILFVFFGIALVRVCTDYNSSAGKSISNEEYTEKINTLKKEIKTAEEELDSQYEQLSQIKNVSEDGFEYGNFYEVDLFKEASKKYDMDYRLPYAIAVKESGSFTSVAYVTYNNPGGIMNNGYIAIFESKKDGIEFMCKMIYEVYVVNGVDTPDGIQALYCPDSETWAPSVQAIINNLAPDED